MGEDTGIMGELETLGQPDTESPDTLPELETPFDSPEEPVETETPEVPETETPEAPEGGEKPEAPQAAAPKEVLPAALSKAIRELKQQHPDQAEALKALNDSYYAHRAYRAVYASPEEAQADKAALEALGGREGIISMRNDINSIQQFDAMAAEGNPKVMDGLAEEFPEGFKRLVPAAIEKLAQMDRRAFTETMRGPLLQMMEGDGLVDSIASAIEELKAGNADRAQRELNRIAAWYNELRKTETEYKNRYQDPRLGELEQRETKLREQQAGIMRDHVVRELDSYLSETVSGPLAAQLKGLKISKEGVDDLKTGIAQEVYKALGSNKFYSQSIADLMKQGNIDKVIAFAKPHIDAARRKAITSVLTRRYGSLPAVARKPLTTTAAPNGSGNQRSGAPASNRQPIPIAKAPDHNDVDFSKDPSFVNYISGRAWLKNGKFVTWGDGAKRS